MLKWIGACTAVLSLVFGLRQLTVLVFESRDRQRQVTELLAVGRLQQNARDYKSAWKSLGKAAELRPNDSGVRTAQEDLAMAWHADIQGDPGPMPFGATVDLLAPVLTRGGLAAEGARKADLLSHLGWADFLRWRDGQRSIEPAERYRQSLALDPQNGYAHAMLGHWTLWRGGSLEDANRHFGSALASARERSYVRRLRMAALSNRTDAAAGLEILRAANDLRKGHEPIEAADRARVWGAYYALLIASSAEISAEQLLTAIPPAEQVATYRWALENAGYAKSKGFVYEYLLARLQEAAGQRAEALATYRLAHAKAPADAVGRLRSRVDSAIARLSGRR